ncbi:hypothetical protein [Streptomyces sp. NPDC047108]|uniref:hypothetical protein n=1 Tax=Streptomyces sp. NPDC047108 TaxID=3155025 RepID=UPI0033ECC572
MFRHAFLASPSAVADAPKAALAVQVTTPSAHASLASRAVAAVAAATAAAASAAAVAADATVTAPLGGARS